MNKTNKSSELDIKVARAQGWKYESNGVDSYWTKIYEWVTPEGSRMFRSDFRECYQPSTNWKHTGWLMEKYNISVSHQNGKHIAKFNEFIADGVTTQEAVCLAVVKALGEE